jgi:hypothetical protein
MMQKLAESQKHDMMFDLSTDPFELSNLLGINGMTAANHTIIHAEHLRCLLLDWMTRLDGTVGYYSDPAANYGQGNGDISEIRERQSWKTIGFWTSASDTMTLEMAKVSWTGDTYVRHEWLYMGTGIPGQTIKVSSMSNAWVPVRITFSSPAELYSTPLDDSLVIEWTESTTNGLVVTPTTTTTVIALTDRQ